MAEPFVVSASKLVPPRPRRPVVDRPRLLRDLQEGLTRRLVVVTAEAGYGKTCLLASALCRLDGPVAWLTLDETDTDPNLFAGALVLALRHVAPAIGQAALDVFSTGPGPDVLAAAMLRAIERRAGPAHAGAQRDQTMGAGCDGAAVASARSRLSADSSVAAS